MSYSEFLTLAKESSFNIFKLYEKAPNETLITLGILILFIFVIIFLIYRSIKINRAIKLIEEIKTSQTYNGYSEKFSILVDELPKRKDKVANSLNSSKMQIYLLGLKLLSPMTIKEKIEKYVNLSEDFKKISISSEKLKNEELANFFLSRSKDLIEKDLILQIENYYKNTLFDLNELDNIDAIVDFANKTKKIDQILEPMKSELDRFSFSYNLDLYKLVENMDPNKSKQIFEYCKNKIDQLFISGKDEISSNILDYLLKKEQNQKVYDYISNLKLKNYLQYLYNLYFDKKDDINLDLAFISNPLKINNGYKQYLDNSLTHNWRDEKHIKFLSKSKGVLDILGHEEFRGIIQRIETLENSKKLEEKIDEAIKIAKKAELVALEAKSLNKNSINIK